MSRVKTADQCRTIKPQGPHDQKIYHCGRRAGHVGPHSAGKYHKWMGPYTQTAKERKG